MTRLATFLLVSLLLWLVLALPAGLLAGAEGLAYSATAACLCVIPTAATLVWGRRVLGGPIHKQLLLVVAGTGLRMAFVLLGGLALYFAFSFFHQVSFWIWILVFYLFTLALEMILLLAEPKQEPKN